jgi:hypothetical protein
MPDCHLNVSGGVLSCTADKNNVVSLGSLRDLAQAAFYVLTEIFKNRLRATAVFIVAKGLVQNRVFFILYLLKGRRNNWLKKNYRLQKNNYRK